MFGPVDKRLWIVIFLLGITAFTDAVISYHWATSGSWMYSDTADLGEPNINISGQLKYTNISCTNDQHWGQDATGVVICVNNSNYGMDEATQDIIADMIINGNHTNINPVYNDSNDTLNLIVSAAAGDTWNTTEEMQDAVGSAFSTGLLYSDAGNFMTFDCSDVDGNHLSCAGEVLNVADDWWDAYIDFMGTTTSGKICRWDGSEIDCDYDDSDTIRGNTTAEIWAVVDNGTFLKLTGGTMTGNLIVLDFINSTGWQNVTITESQISDLGTTVSLDSERTSTNTSMKAYVDGMDVVFNDSLKAYLDAQDTSFNNSLKSYLDAQDMSYNNSVAGYCAGLDSETNTSLKAYLDAQDTSFNTSLKNYCDGQDVSYNNSMKVYVDARDTYVYTTSVSYTDSENIDFNNSMKAYVDGMDADYNTTMKDYVDGAFQTLPEDDTPDDDSEVPDDITIDSTKNITTTDSMLLDADNKCIWIGDDQDGCISWNGTCIIIEKFGGSKTAIC